MEIRCSQCSHLGAAADVQPVDDGVGLVCAECGHVNIASAGEENQDSDTADSVEPDPHKVLSEIRFGPPDGADGSTSSPGAEFVERSMERLIPKPGSGKRCPKCVHLLELEDDNEHCARCGLSIIESNRHPAGKAPWEQPPPGCEEAHQEAKTRWEDVVDDQKSTTIDEFVDFVIDAGLVDFGIRKVQTYLVDHPDDEQALAGLRQLAESLKVAIHMAQSRAEAKSEEFNDDVKRFRTNMLVAALLFWTLILLLFLWLFWDKF